MPPAIIDVKNCNKISGQMYPGPSTGTPKICMFRRKIILKPFILIAFKYPRTIVIRSIVPKYQFPIFISLCYHTFN